MKQERLTKQKRAIMNYLEKVYSHPKAEEIYKEVKKEIPSISLGTVYRNLNQLSESGKILKLELEGEFHFDGHTKPHQHAVCINCQKIIDLENPGITKEVEKQKKTIPGFKIYKTKIIFEGYCEECLKKMKHNI